MQAIDMISKFRATLLSPPRLPFRHSGVEIILGYLASNGNPSTYFPSDWPRPSTPGNANLPIGGSCS